MELVPEWQEERRAARVACLRIAAGAVVRRFIAALCHVVDDPAVPLGYIVEPAVVQRTVVRFDGEAHHEAHHEAQALRCLGAGIFMAKLVPPQEIVFIFS